MSWATYTATGNGRIAFRMVIEGLGYEAVTDSSMEKTTSDGRVRAAGMLLDGIIIDEQCDPSRATIEGQPMSIQILDRQRDDVWTTALAKHPTSYSYIVSDVEAATSATTISLNTGLFYSEGDVVHLGTEAVLLGPASGNNFTGCTRAYWQTIAQKHFTRNGAEASYAAVTNVPASLEGRRAYFYAYGEGDSMTGDGTLVWRGVCSTDAGMGSDGTSWGISVDPIWSLFKGDLGAASKGTVRPRGIYYPAHKGAGLRILEMNVDNQVNAELIPISGYFDDRAAFCAALNAEILTRCASWDTITDGGKIHAEPLDNGSWRMVIRTADNSANVRHIQGKAYNPMAGSQLWETLNEPRLVLEQDGDVVVSNGLVTGTEYVSEDIDWPASEGMIGFNNPHIGVRDTPNLDDNPSNRIYLDSDTDITELDSVAIDWEDPYPENEWHRILAYNAELRYIQVGISSGTRVWGDSAPSLTFKRQFTPTGSGLDGFRDGLVAISLTTANKNGTPLVTTEELASWTSAVADASAGNGYLSSRLFWASESIGLDEIIEHDCRLLGLFPAIDTSIKVGLRPVKPPVSSSFGALSIGADTILVDEGFPSWTKNADGTIHSVLYKTQWDGSEHNGDEFLVRDVTAVSQMKFGQTLEVAPRSMSSLEYFNEYPSYQDFVTMAQPVLGLYGSSYSVIELDVSFKAFSVKCGDIVKITHPDLPNPSDGTRGLTDKACMVIGRTWEPHRARGKLRMIAALDSFGGYSPSFKISSYVSGTGTTTVAVKIKDEDQDSNAVLPTGAVPSTYLATGDQIAILQWDTASPTRKIGYISSSVPDTFDGSGEAQITLELTSAWTYDAGYYLRYDRSNNIADVDNQKDHVHVGSSPQARITYSDGSASAFRFA